MDIKYSSQCNLLSKQILSLFHDGITITTDVIDYIDSIFGSPSLEELNEILVDTENCERDSLLELIFYPDERIQMQFEDILESSKFQKKDKDKVEAALLSANYESILLFPGNKNFLRLFVPQPVVKKFILRLNIYKKADLQILEAVNANVLASDINLVKVKLRNRRFTETENKINFFCMFLKSNLPTHPVFFECLDFIVEFFNELKEGNDIFDSLSQKKIFLSNSIKKTKQLADQAKGKNFEILMSQNIRIPSININEYKRKIELVDMIYMYASKM